MSADERAAGGLIPIAPGRLYVMLGTEFRLRTAKECGWCRMPLLQVSERPNARGGHWSVQPGLVCSRCRPHLEAIVERFGQEYDVWPVFADSSIGHKPERR